MIIFHPVPSGARLLCMSFKSGHGFLCVDTRLGRYVGENRAVSLTGFKLQRGCDLFIPSSLACELLNLCREAIDLRHELVVGQPLRM